MQLQASTYYAVSILVHLFKHPGDKVRNIAEAVGITLPLATRIILRLRQDGYIVNIPNRRGCYTLGKPASEIRFYDVFVATEGELCISHCFDKGTQYEDGTHSKTHVLFQTIQDNLMEDMLSASIADLV